MSSKPLFIVADDLTGAADCAARCFRHGYSASILRLPGGGDCFSEACAFTSDSRMLPPADAAQRVSALIRSICKPGVQWYKKMDSTLRGNIGSEIDAFITTLQLDLVLLCPAFPLQKRAMLDGMLLMDGTVQDGAHLPTLLASQSKYPSRHIPLAVLEDQPDALIRYIAEGFEQGIKIFSVDAVTEKHLPKVVDAYHKLPYNTLLSGSAGLVGALAASEERVAAQSSRASHGTVDRVLIVIGSGSETARRQVNYLEARPEVSVMLSRETRSYRDAKTVVLCLPPPSPGAALDKPNSRRALGGLVAAALQQIDLHKPDLLIVTGGDTSMELLSGLGIERLEVQAELLPGIPLTVGMGAKEKQYQIILKPGAFGGDAVFGELLDMLQGTDARLSAGEQVEE